MPVRPDPNKETILLRYPLDGSVKVVSALKDEKGSPSLIWVEPSGKNQPRFYECNNCREVANFFDMEYRRAFAENRDRKTIPELYKVPFDKVGLIGEELRKLSDDPQNAVILETVKKYRTYTAQLNRITFDIARMPIAELAAEGFDIEQMKKPSNCWKSADRPNYTRSKRCKPDISPRRVPILCTVFSTKTGKSASRLNLLFPNLNTERTNVCEGN